MSKHPEYFPASVESFVLIKDLEKHKGKLVHVEGWSKGTQFVYLRTIDGMHYLRTPKGRKYYQTRNRLLMTRRQSCPRGSTEERLVSTEKAESSILSEGINKEAS